MVEQRVEDEVQERIASCVRGYHIYNKKWTAAVGEILCCAREVGNVTQSLCLKTATSSATCLGRDLKFVLFSFSVVALFHEQGNIQETYCKVA